MAPQTPAFTHLHERRQVVGRRERHLLLLEAPGDGPPHALLLGVQHRLLPRPAPARPLQLLALPLLPPLVARGHGGELSVFVCMDQSVEIVRCGRRPATKESKHTHTIALSTEKKNTHTHTDKRTRILSLSSSRTAVGASLGICGLRGCPQSSAMDCMNSSCCSFSSASFTCSLLWGGGGAGGQYIQKHTPSIYVQYMPAQTTT